MYEVIFFLHEYKELFRKVIYNFLYICIMYYVKGQIFYKHTNFGIGHVHWCVAHELWGVQRANSMNSYVHRAYASAETSV